MLLIIIIILFSSAISFVVCAIIDGCSSDNISKECQKFCICLTSISVILLIPSCMYFSKLTKSIDYTTISIYIDTNSPCYFIEESEEDNIFIYTDYSGISHMLKDIEMTDMDADRISFVKIESPVCSKLQKILLPKYFTSDKYSIHVNISDVITLENKN